MKRRTPEASEQNSAKETQKMIETLFLIYRDRIQYDLSVENRDTEKGCAAGEFVNKYDPEAVKLYYQMQDVISHYVSKYGWPVFDKKDKSSSK